MGLNLDKDKFLMTVFSIIGIVLIIIGVVLLEDKHKDTGGVIIGGGALVLFVTIGSFYKS